MANKGLSSVLEQAMQEAPALLLQQGKQEQALEKYRYSLAAVESPGVNSVRLKLLCQMAELLLQGFPDENYKQPNMIARDSAWKPKLYTGLNQVIQTIHLFSLDIVTLIVFYSLFLEINMKKSFLYLLLLKQ